MFNSHTESRIKTGNTELESVEEIKYLGKIINKQ